MGTEFKGNGPNRAEESAAFQWGFASRTIDCLNSRYRDLLKTRLCLSPLGAALAFQPESEDDQ